MAKSDDNEAQRRAYFRLLYPQVERPCLLTDGASYPVSEISEGGMRLVALDQGDDLGDGIFDRYSTAHRYFILL